MRAQGHAHKMFMERREWHQGNHLVDDIVLNAGECICKRGQMRRFVWAEEQIGTFRRCYVFHVVEVWVLALVTAKMKEPVENRHMLGSILG